MVAQVFNLCAPVENRCHQELSGAFARQPLALLKQRKARGANVSPASLNAPLDTFEAAVSISLTEYHVPGIPCKKLPQLAFLPETSK
jgi:hypothetical protein